MDTHLHRMQLGIGRLASSKLNSGNTQAPYISFVVVSALLDHLRRHPIWRSDKRIFLGRQCARELPGDTKIGQFDFASRRKKDIRR